MPAPNVIALNEAGREHLRRLEREERIARFQAYAVGEQSEIDRTLFGIELPPPLSVWDFFKRQD